MTAGWNKKYVMIIMKNSLGFVLVCIMIPDWKNFFFWNSKLSFTYLSKFMSNNAWKLIQLFLFKIVLLKIPSKHCVEKFPWFNKLSSNFFAMDCLKLTSPAQFAWIWYIGLRRLTRASICSVNHVCLVWAKPKAEIVHCAEEPSMTQYSSVNLIRKFKISIRRITSAEKI
jgi:hypothetical protein